MTKTKSSIVALFICAMVLFGIADVKYCVGLSGSIKGLSPESVCQPGYKVVSCYTDNNKCQYFSNPDYHLFAYGPDYGGDSKFCYNEHKQPLPWKEVIALICLIVIIIAMAVFVFWLKRNRKVKSTDHK